MVDVEIYCRKLDLGYRFAVMARLRKAAGYKGLSVVYLRVMLFTDLLERFSKIAIT